MPTFVKKQILSLCSVLALTVHANGVNPPYTATYNEERKKEIDAANEKLLAASAQGNLKGVEQALELGASVLCEDSLGNTPLMLAVMYGQVAIIKKLLAYGPNLSHENVCGATALMQAEMKGQDAIAQLLLAHHAKED
jgi:ankyrin repeat protein